MQAAMRKSRSEARDIGANELTDSPGMSISRLFQLVAPSKVIPLIPVDSLAVLEGIEPALQESNKFIEFAEKLIDKDIALRDPNQRARIISLLPIRKATELCRNLGVSPGRDPFKAAIQGSSNSASLPHVFDFFGVNFESEVGKHSKVAESKVNVKHGLFSHQREAASRVRNMLSKHPHKGILHMPTGSGKTRTSMHVVAEQMNRQEPGVVVWLAHSVELLNQAADAFRSAWQSLGNRDVNVYEIWGSFPADLSSIEDGFVVGGLAKMVSIQRRDPKMLASLATKASLIVLDEAHQAIAPTYSSVLESLSEIRLETKLLGLTATPGRAELGSEQNSELSDFFGRNKVTLNFSGYDNPVKFLCEHGFLSKPSFRTLNVEAGLELTGEDLEDLSKSIDISEEVLEKVGRNGQRNIRILACCRDLATRHTRIIVFVPSVQCAEILAGVLRTQGLESHAISAKTKIGARRHVIRRFRSNDAIPIVLFNYGVLTTGFDAPKTTAAVIARPTKSLVLYSQMVGRATRGVKSGGSLESEIVTVVDTELPGFGDVSEAFRNWDREWSEQRRTS